MALPVSSALRPPAGSSGRPAKRLNHVAILHGTDFDYRYYSSQAIYRKRQQLGFRARVEGLLPQTRSMHAVCHSPCKQSEAEAGLEAAEREVNQISKLAFNSRAHPGVPSSNSSTWMDWMHVVCGDAESTDLLIT